MDTPQEPDIFDLKILTDEDLGCIEFVLNSPAYITSFRPYMEKMINSMQYLWLDRSQARKDQYPDDFLAGQVVFGKGLLEFFDRIVRETQMERIHKAMENMTPERVYEENRQRGLVKPVVGLDQDASPRNPAEDF